MQGRRNPPALGGGGVDGSFEQELTLPLRPSYAPEEVPEQRCEQHDEQEQAAQRDSGEAPPELAGALADLVVRRVDLEQRLGTARGPHRPVHLDQLVADLPVELVLGAGEVRDLRDGARLDEHLALLGPERELLPDQLGLVGVEDGAVLAPQLHAHHTIAEDALVHQVVELRDRFGVAGQEPVGQGGLDHHIGEHVSGVRGVVNRLPLREAARRQGASHGHRDQYQRHPDGELRDDPAHPQRRLVGDVDIRAREGDPAGLLGRDGLPDQCLGRGVGARVSRRIRGHRTPCRRCRHRTYRSRRRRCRRCRRCRRRRLPSGDLWRCRPLHHPGARQRWRHRGRHSTSCVAGSSAPPRPPLAAERSPPLSPERSPPLSPERSPPWSSFASCVAGSSAP